MKTQRHQKILATVQHKPIETQEELAEELKRQGFEITQATVSRDIKELGLIKVPTGDNRYRYAAQETKYAGGSQTKITRVFKDSVIGMDCSENIIVVKTTPGAAQTVALVIDNVGWQEIIGTVAGDDTVMAVVKPKSAVRQVLQKFNSYLL